jgi:hypothetical protein
MGKRLDNFRNWLAAFVGTNKKDVPGNNQPGSDKTGDPKANKEPTKESDSPPWWVFVLLLVTVMALIILFGWTAASNSLSLTGLLVAAASIAVGGLLGFLFGIPRMPDQSPPKAGEGEDSSYNPSNNLEQISDWLTKILIGVGLVELKEIGAILRSIVNIVVSSYKDPPPGVEIISYVAIVTFTIFGFLASFLWTRLNYGPLQTMTDDGMRRHLKGLRNQMSDQQKELADQKEELSNQKEEMDARLQEINILAEETEARLEEIKTLAEDVGGQAALGKAEAPIVPDVHLEESEKKHALPDEISEKIKEFEKFSPEWNSNPVVQLFPDAPAEKDGLRLEGEILNDLKTSLRIVLRVVRLDGKPVEDVVIFLLHPTFGKQALQYVKEKDGVAGVRILSGGWFTAAAIITNETATVLSYDLRNLPGAPEWFKNT